MSTPKEVAKEVAKAVDKHLSAAIEFQRKKILRLAEELGVHLTGEDVLNPHDFPVLMRSSHFNFEDGYLAGMLAAQMMVRREMK